MGVTYQCGRDLLMPLQRSFLTLHVAPIDTRDDWRSSVAANSMHNPLHRPRVPHWFAPRRQVAWEMYAGPRPGANDSSQYALKHHMELRCSAEKTARSRNRRCNYAHRRTPGCSNSADH